MTTQERLTMEKILIDEYLKKNLHMINGMQRRMLVGKTSALGLLF